MQVRRTIAEYVGMHGERATFSVHTEVSRDSIARDEKENKAAVDKATGFYSLLAQDTSISELVIFTDGVCIKELADALAQNKKLTKLQLAGNSLSFKDAKLLFKALQRNDTLNEANFSNNHFGPKAGEVIAKFIKENKALQKLDLYQNGLGDNAVKLIIESLRFNRSLVKIDLGLNQVKSVTDSVIEIAEVNKTLILIDLKSNFLSEKEVKRIKTATSGKELFVNCNFNSSKNEFDSFYWANSDSSHLHSFVLPTHLDLTLNSKSSRTHTKSSHYSSGLTKFEKAPLLSGKTAKVSHPAREEENAKPSTCVLS